MTYTDLILSFARITMLFACTFFMADSSFSIGGKDLKGYRCFYDERNGFCQ